MRKGIIKNVIATMLIVLGAAFMNSNAVLADNVLVVNESGSASAGISTAAYSFTIPAAASNSEVIFTAAVNKATGVTMNIYKGGALLKSEIGTIGSSNWVGYATGGGQYAWMIPLAAGDYSVSFTFDVGVNYTVAVSHENMEEDVYDDPIIPAQPKPVPNDTPAPWISNSNAVITVGFSQKLKVYNGSVKKWTSSKKKVAAVNSKGKVTARKAGKTTITATLKNGKKLKCKVVVMKNQWVQKKKTWNDAPFLELYLYPYNVQYNKKGDLVIKVLALNNSGYKVRKISGVSIKLTTATGSTIGTLSVPNKSYTLATYKSGTVTFTIPKKKLKKKKADLRNAYLSFRFAGYYYDLY